MMFVLFSLETRSISNARRSLRSDSCVLPYHRRMDSTQLFISFVRKTFHIPV